MSAELHLKSAPFSFSRKNGDSSGLRFLYSPAVQPLYLLNTREKYFTSLKPTERATFSMASPPKEGFYTFSAFFYWFIYS